MMKPIKNTLSVMVLSLLSSAIIAQTCSDNILLTSPNERFIIGESIVTDTKTGLIWMTCSVGQTFKQLSPAAPCEGAASQLSWKDALDESTRFEGGNRLDWRLPNIKELSSLTERACFEPAINESVFPTTEGSYWTSSPDVSGTGQTAWVVGFNFGGDTKNGKHLLRSVRFVAGGDAF